MIWFYLLPRRLRGKLKQHRPVIWLFNLLTIFIICCLCFVFLFKFIERVSWGYAIWQVWQTVTTVGYGDRPVETTWGRIITIIIGTSGLSLLPAFVAAGFEFLIYISDRRRYGLMKNPHKDGYVIFNFPGVPKFLSFVREIRHIENDVGICVVDGRIEELPPSVSMVPNVHFIKGNILSKDTYHMAGLRLREKLRLLGLPFTHKSALRSISRSKITEEIVELILTMKKENGHWGSKRIRDESHLYHMHVLECCKYSYC